MANPKLGFLIVCETAFASQEGNLNIIGIFENIFTPDFPINYPKMTVVFNVSGSVGDYNFTLSIKDPNKQVIVPPIKGGFNITGTNVKFGFIGNLVNLKFEKEGFYAVSLEVNGRLLGETSFRVAKILSR